MKTMFRWPSIACGISVMCVSLLNGCAVPVKPVMNAVDLDRFQVDCTRKEEQVRFLQAQRPGTNDRLLNGVVNALNPWDVVINSDRYNDRLDVHSGRNDWLVNQHLRTIARDCS